MDTSNSSLFWPQSYYNFQSAFHEKLEQMETDSEEELSEEEVSEEKGFGFSDKEVDMGGYDALGEALPVVQQAEPRYEQEILQERLNLQNQSIDFNLSSLSMQEGSVVAKAAAMSPLMSKLELESLKKMAAFIQVNRDRLLQIAREEKGENGLYIRHEVSGLPLSLFITSEGRFIWELKRKAIDQKTMTGNFKQVNTCLDHDRVEVLISATMKVSPYAEKAAQRELIAGKTLGKLKLKNVVEVLSCANYLAKPGKSIKSKVRIIMRLYPLGDLQKRISEKKFTEEDKNTITGHLLEALYQIHHLGWVHGDCKPANILFDSSGVPHMGDLGSAHKKNVLEVAGQVYYRHPMFSLMEPGEKTGLQEKQDQFSLGLTLAQMELGLPKLPWETDELREMINNVVVLAGHEESAWEVIKLRMEIVFKMGVAFEKFYHEFPSTTLRQKFILKLLNPNIELIPSAEEAKAMWADL